MTRDKRDSAPVTETSDSFLTRWSRRKRAVREQPPAESSQAVDGPAADATPSESEAVIDDPAVDMDGDVGADDPAVEPATGTEPRADDLPPPETLSADSDFTAYLGKRVAREVRRAALRQLFSSPKFNVRDGLDDYDEDYTNFQSLGDTVTAHMRHHVERLRQRAMADDHEEEVASDASTETSSAAGQEQARPSSAAPGGSDGGTDHVSERRPPERWTITPTDPPIDQEDNDTT